MRLEFNFAQSGVVPYRKKSGKIEILLITSMKKKRWIIPKGYVEFNMSAFESAKKEAYEEAGIIGTNETAELGHYNRKKPAGLTTVKVFSMEVTEELEEYPEKKARKRKWFPQKEAAEIISMPEVGQMIMSLESKLK